MIIKIVFLIFFSLAGGLAVGSGFVAFLAVLGVIPRLTQLSKTMKMIHWYEWAIVFGGVAGTFLSLREPVGFLPALLLVPLGLFAGIFVGMLAAALTEVLNVFPILAKRVGIEDHIIVLIMAIVFGKVFGSLFHWIYFVN